MEVTLPMYFGFASIMVLLFGIYSYFFSASKQKNPFEYFLKPPVKNGSRLIYMGTGGVHYDSRIKDLKVYNGGIADIELEAGIKLYGVDLEEHIELPKTWNNVAGEEGVVYCCVDGINRITKFNQIKKENYLELEESFKIGETERIKESLLEQAEFADKRRLQYTGAMMGNILPDEQNQAQYGQQ